MRYIIGYKPYPEISSKQIESNYFNGVPEGYNKVG